MEIKWGISVKFSSTDMKREGEDKTVRERDEKVEELSVLYTEAKRWCRINIPAGVSDWLWSLKNTLCTHSLQWQTHLHTLEAHNRGIRLMRQETSYHGYSRDYRGNGNSDVTVVMVAEAAVSAVTDCKNTLFVAYRVTPLTDYHKAYLHRV